MCWTTRRILAITLSAATCGCGAGAVHREPPVDGTVYVCGLSPPSADSLPGQALTLANGPEQPTWVTDISSDDFPSWWKHCDAGAYEFVVGLDQVESFSADLVQYDTASREGSFVGAIKAMELLGSACTTHGSPTKTVLYVELVSCTSGLSATGVLPPSCTTPTVSAAVGEWAAVCADGQLVTSPET